MLQALTYPACVMPGVEGCVGAQGTPPSPLSCSLGRSTHEVTLSQTGILPA